MHECCPSAWCCEEQHLIVIKSSALLLLLLLYFETRAQHESGRHERSALTRGFANCWVG